MTTVLSSRWTPFSKFVFPALWGGLWSYFTALLFTDPSQVGWQGGGVPPPWAKWVFLVALVAGGELCRRVCVPLKFVSLEDGYLRISNYWRDVRIPIAEVSGGGIDPDASVETDVTVGFITVVDRRPLVYLEFRKETAFGRMIEFIPRSPESVKLLRARLRLPDSDHPAPEADDPAEEIRGRGTV